MGVSIGIVNHMRNMPTQLHEFLPNYTSMPVDLITVFLRSLTRCRDGNHASRAAPDWGILSGWYVYRGQCEPNCRRIND